MHRHFVIFIFSLCFGCQNTDKKGNTDSQDWSFGIVDRFLNEPIITPDTVSTFKDPITGKKVLWKSMATFNPAAIVRNDSIFVLFRSEERKGEDGIGSHTSRLGLAYSTDGIHYEMHNEPIFFPKQDNQIKYEYPGGTEDPRIVVTEEGKYIMTYTQWNRDVPRLAVATSTDLLHWDKHGPILEQWKDGKYNNQESKSGAIVTQLKGGKLVAAKINGEYWMYFGVPHIWLASSKDLINWKPIENYEGNLAPVLSPRPGYFDSWLVEATPPILTEEGIVVLYNAGNSENIGQKGLANRVYTGGQALFDKSEPWKLTARQDKPFIQPELDFEKSGQYKDGTTFIEGLTYFKNEWYLFYGTADSMVGVVKLKVKDNTK